MSKTYEEINQRIRDGEVVVVSVEEAIHLAEQKGVQKASEYIDIVTTATFGPMCSSGVFLNFGHSQPPIRITKATLNGVSAYSGIAAVDAYIGATEQSRQNHKYGGAHVIRDLVEGKSIELIGKSKGSDCYPNKFVKRNVSLKDLNEVYMFNPRNAYQNYSGAVNTSREDIYTYMGRLKADMGNVNYSTTGQMSPLMKDPQLRTIGIGTRIYLAGAQGYVSWQGTQFDSNRDLNDYKIPKQPAATIATIGDLKEMKSKYLKPIYLKNYGISLFIGIAIPIPILDKELFLQTIVKDSEINTEIVDYSSNPKKVIKEVNYQELKQGQIEINKRKIKTHNISNIKIAKEIEADLIKEIQSKRFLLQKPIEKLPVNLSVKRMVVN